MNMTTATNNALQSLKDMQQSIESWEERWMVVSTAGGSTEKIDSEIDRLLAIRHGMEMIMHSMGIKFDRKDYREVDLNGNSKIRTMWYLIK